MREDTKKHKEMKILATSDWHLGNMFHGNDRLEEHKHFLRWLLQQLREQQPDALLVAGDVYDNGNPSAAAQAVYYDFLASAQEECPQMRIVITAGNHDAASRLEAPRPLLTRSRVEVRGTLHRVWVPDVEADGQGTWQTDLDDLIVPLDDRYVVLVVPYLRSDVVMSYQKGKDSGNDEQTSYTRGVSLLLKDLTERARELYPGRRLVMMAHMYATGAEIASHDASEKIVIGGLEEVNMEDWSDHPDYLTCGHIHKRQHIWQTDWARYTGSVLPMSFAEKDYTHGVDMITMDEEHRRPKVELLEYKPQHRLRVLPETDEDMTQKQLEKLIKKELRERQNGELGDDYDYVMLKVNQDRMRSNDEVKALEQLVNSMNAVHCKTQRIVKGLDVTTLSGQRQLKSIDDIMNRDVMETLRECYAVMTGMALTERQELLLREIVSTSTANN